MSCTLILNAAEGHIQLVVGKNGDDGCLEFVCAQEWTAPGQGTELLTPVLADVFRHLHLRPAEIARIACVAGPGSFTGLRLVLTTAAAFRRATGARVASLNTLHALAASVPTVLLEQKSIVRVITHARRGLVHGQDFLCGNGLPEAIGAPAMWTLEQVLREPRPHFVVGSGVKKNLALLQDTLPQGVRLFPELFDQPTPNALLAMTRALPPDAWQERDLDPLYLRPCDAEDNLSGIARKRGQDPDAVHADLDRLLGPITPGQIH